MDSAFGANSEGRFEPDDFYESFLAPKFHDFTAPEEPIDPDAYFLGKPGMLPKKPVFEDVMPKIQKDSSKALPGIQQQGLPQTPVAAEKGAVSTGSAKKTLIRTASGSLTPLASKNIKNGNSTYNSPAHHPAQEKAGNQSLKPTSLAKKMQTCENDDPNSDTHANHSADHTTVKVVKSTRKVPEDKPAITRQRSKKLLEVKLPVGAGDVQSVPKNSGDCLPAKTSVQKQTSSEKATSRKESPSKSSGTSSSASGVVKALKHNVAPAACSPTGKDHGPSTAGCKTPAKDSVTHHQDVKKVAASVEAAGSPYSGHHCRSSRCAANDPNQLSPAPSQKYLVAKKGTPGSIKRILPNSAKVEKCNEEVKSDRSTQSSDEAHSEGSERELGCTHLTSQAHKIAVVDSHGRGGSKANGRTKVALEEVFKNMALESAPSSTSEKQATNEAIAQLEVTELNKTDDGDFKEVSLVENRSDVEPAHSLPARNGTDGSANSVSCNDKAASSPEPGTTASSLDVADAQTNARGMDLFLKLASEKIDCLDSVDLSALELSQTKQGKKRKSGELMPEGGRKRANLAKGVASKVLPKQTTQAKAPASSKTPQLKMLKMRRLSVARRITNPRVTNPQPFRLRTQERGAVKEEQFRKKVEEYKAAKEGFHSAFQGLAAVEPRIPGKFLKTGSTHVFSAKRAEVASKDDKAVEGKTQKPTSVPVLKPPVFNYPFKPHRSTKKLTVPQDPKFHTVRRASPSGVAVPAQA